MFKMNNMYWGSTLKPHVQISFLSELPYMLVTSIGFNSHFQSSRRSMADGVSQILRMGKGKCGSHCAQGCTVRVRREGILPISTHQSTPTMCPLFLKPSPDLLIPPRLCCFFCLSGSLCFSRCSKPLHQTIIKIKWNKIQTDVPLLLTSYILINPL